MVHWASTVAIGPQSLITLHQRKTTNSTATKEAIIAKVVHHLRHPQAHRQVANAMPSQPSSLMIGAVIIVTWVIVRLICASVMKLLCEVSFRGVCALGVLYHHALGGFVVLNQATVAIDTIIRFGNVPSATK